MTKSADSQQYTDGHCHRWPQHQHGRQQLHLLQVRSQSTLEATWKGKRGQNTSIKLQRSFQKNTSLPPLCLVSPLPLLLGKVPPPGADSGQPAASSRDTTSCQLKSQNRGNWAFTKWKNVWGLTIAPLLLAWETQVLPSWSVAPRLAFAWTQER